MKKTVAVLANILMIFSAFCENIPVWIKNPDREYPDSSYIKAVGEGHSVLLAKSNAVSEIALFFDTKINVVKLSVEELQELSTGDVGISASNQSYQQIAQISSEAEFFCVNFTDAYYDKKTELYSILAYIDKKEAAQIYTARIHALMDSVEAYRIYAKKEKELFLAADALRKAQVLGSLAEKYIHTETIIVPQDSAKFQQDLRTIALIPNERASLKKNMTFSITILQNEKRFDPIFSTVASILEKNGYAYSVAGANYKIIVDISCIEEKYDNGDFVRPSVDVLIINKAGEGVYTYSKGLSRTGGKTMEQAYRRAVTKITQDLEEHFLAE